MRRIEKGTGGFAFSSVFPEQFAGSPVTKILIHRWLSWSQDEWTNSSKIFLAEVYHWVLCSMFMEIEKGIKVIYRFRDAHTERQRQRQDPLECIVTLPWRLEIATPPYFQALP